MEETTKRGNYKRGNYKEMSIMDIDPKYRLFFFLVFEKNQEVNSPIFYNLKDLVVSFLEFRKIEITENSLRKMYGNLSNLLLNKKTRLKSASRFQKELFKVAFKRAQKHCGVKDKRFCLECPKRQAFIDRFNRSYKVVYPEAQSLRA